MKPWSANLLVSLLAASSAAAGTIQISITSSVAQRDGELRAEVSIANSGNEAAYAVTPSLRFAGREVKGAAVTALAPGSPVTVDLALPLEELRDGRWPFEIEVEYADVNQYPFAALQVGLLQTGSPPPAKVAVMDFESDWRGSRGSVRVKVENLADQARTVRLRLVVPAGLEARDPLHSVELSAWESRPVEFGVVNRTALAGSRLPAFVTAEYDDGPLHHAVLISGVVEIQERTATPESRAWVLWAGAALLGLAFVGLLVMRFLRR